MTLYFVTEGYMDINKLVCCKVERNRMLQVLAFVVQYGSLWFWYFAALQKYVSKTFLSFIWL